MSFLQLGTLRNFFLQTLDQLWATETLNAVLVGVEQEVKTEKQKKYLDIFRAPFLSNWEDSARPTYI